MYYYNNTIKNGVSLLSLPVLSSFLASLFFDFYFGLSVFSTSILPFAYVWEVGWPGEKEREARIEVEKETGQKRSQNRQAEKFSHKKRSYQKYPSYHCGVVVQSYYPHISSVFARTSK